MKLILEISGAGDDDIIIHRVVEKFPVTLGRGYHNDIILQDPHVGQQQMRIDFDGAGWQLTDLGSVNPTSVNGKSLWSSTVPLVSGDIIRTGHATLRVFAADHPVDAPVLLQKAHPVFLWMRRPVNAWIFFVFAVAGVTGWTYMTIWSEQTGLTLAGAGAVTAVTIFIWAALWSVAGRLIRHKSFFMAHLALMSVYLAAGTVVAWASAAVDFLTSASSASIATGYMLNAALLALLLYGSLSLATRMKNKKRIMAAALFAFGLTAGIFSIGMIAEEKFNPDPLYPYHLAPFLDKFAFTTTLEAFLDENEKLFQSDSFVRKKG